MVSTTDLALHDVARVFFHCHECLEANNSVQTTSSHMK
jgi:hypothetical protein